MSKSNRPTEDTANSALSEQTDAPIAVPTADGPTDEVAVTTTNSEPSSPGAIQETLTWLSSWTWWGSTDTAKGTITEAAPIASASPVPSEPEHQEPPTANSSESSATISEAESRPVFDWFAGLFTKPATSPEAELSAAVSQPERLGSNGPEFRELATISPTEVTPSSLSQLQAASSVAVGTVRLGVANAFIAGIRLVSSERDRDEILRWFINARAILARDVSSTEMATALYQSTDTICFAQLLANTVRTSLNNYYGANLPLTLKVAIPVTAIGAGFFGMKGAGLVAFGTGIGLPVVLLMFLGTAGATTIIEAFIKDRSVRDPLTKLLLMFVAFETACRAKKELLDAMRADAMVPERAQVPNDTDAVLAFLMEMDPVAFERHVISFFEQDGHPTGLTARSNDFGVDGYVFHPDGVIVVQCKRYSADNSVGRPAIQQFKGVIEEQRAFKGYFVTTSRFTDEAKESAAKTDRILLVNGDELVKWHKEGRKRM